MKVYIGPDEVKGLGFRVVTGDIKDAATTPDKVLAPNVFYGNDGRQIGTMPNRGGMSAELSAGGSVSILEGYHNGEGVVRAQDLASQTAGDAGAGNIDSGKTAWVNGIKVTGAGVLVGKHGYKKVSAPDATGGTYHQPSKNVQLDPAKSYIFVVYYKNERVPFFHFGVITKGVLNVFLSGSTDTTYNVVPTLDNNCVLYYGPGYDANTPTCAEIYEIVLGE